MDTQNLYLAAAEAQWKQGEDGEVIARDLAQALKYMITKGVVGTQISESVSRPLVLREFYRLSYE